MKTKKMVNKVYEILNRSKKLEIASILVDFEFWGQPRTCYPVVEPTGLFGHLPRS